MLLRKADWNMKVASDLYEVHTCNNDSELITILHSLDDNTIVCLIEAICNVLMGKVRISGTNRSKLKRHASIMRGLAQTRSIISARKAIEQKGSGPFLAALIPIVLSALTSLIGNVLQ